MTHDTWPRSLVQGQSSRTRPYPAAFRVCLRPVPLRSREPLFGELLGSPSRLWASSRFMRRDPRQPSHPAGDNPAGRTRGFLLKAPASSQTTERPKAPMDPSSPPGLPVSYPALPWRTRRDFKSRAPSQWVRGPSPTYRTTVVVS